MNHRNFSRGIAASILVVGALDVSAIYFTGCASQSSTVSSAPALTGSSFAAVEPQIKPVVQTAATVLVVAEPKYAGDIQAAAVAIKALSGTSPSASDIQAALTKVAPQDAKYAALASLIVSLYDSQIAPKMTGASQVDQVLADIAAGLSAAVPAQASSSASQPTILLRIEWPWPAMIPHERPRPQFRTGIAPSEIYSPLPPTIVG